MLSKDLKELSSIIEDIHRELDFLKNLKYFETEFYTTSRRIPICDKILRSIADSITSVNFEVIREHPMVVSLNNQRIYGWDIEIKGTVFYMDISVLNCHSSLNCNCSSSSLGYLELNHKKEEEILEWVKTTMEKTKIINCHYCGQITI